MASDERPRGMGPGRGRGTVGTLLKVTAGAGLAVAGAYGLSRLGQKRGMDARLERLEALLEALSKQDGGSAQ
jgi:hypothetical protein